MSDNFTSLCQAGTDELLDELTSRHEVGAILLLKPTKIGDEDVYWSKLWGGQWEILGMLTHAKEMQLRSTAALTVFTEDDEDDA